jgi:multidrug efflux system membrane fusion protein
VQRSTGTVPIRATVANADRRFWPGQFIEVRLILRVLAGAVLVPVQAVQKSQQGPFVYVVRDDASAELRQVVTGQRHGERIVVERGVAAGERVITTGQIAVAPGGKVHVVEATSAP